MNPSDPLRLDEHLARVLAAYDQGLDGGDLAPTLPVPPPRADENPTPVPGERPAGPLSAGPLNQGSLSDLVPESNPNGPYPTLRPTPLSVGTAPRVGRFELRRQLGRGGCGVVFLAYDPKLKREVALKIPRPELLLSPDARRRLAREARAAAEFDHPNLVPVYETGEVGPVSFIATAYVPGQTLAEWLDRQAFPVPVRQAARLVSQVAEAVQHAHDRGVLHRDLKPSNVILQSTRAEPGDPGPPPGSCPLRGDHVVPRVVDFGLAKVAEAGPGDTHSRQVLGTPKYMAPEQAQARHEEVGPAADVYALGVILYELVAGRAPFDGATDLEVLRQAIDGQLTPPRAFRPDLPRDLEAIVLRAMARSPARRYPSAVDLADDLRRFLDGLPTHARPLNAVGRAARFLRRNDQWVAAAAVTGVAVLLLGIGFWSNYQTRQLRTGRDSLLAEQNRQMRSDRMRGYARHVRDAFYAWRAGDAQPMAESLEFARQAARTDGDRPDFAWGYLSGLGRVEKRAVPAGPATALAVDPGGPRLAVGRADGTLTVWHRETGAKLGEARAEPGELAHLVFVRGGAGLVSAGGVGPPRGWSLGADHVPMPGPAFEPAGGPVTALAVAADGLAVYTGDAAGVCRCRDAATGRVTRTWAAPAPDPITAVAVAPDGSAVAVAVWSGPGRLLPLAGDAPPAEVRGAAGAPALAFLRVEAGGWLLAVAGKDDGAVRLFDRDGREVRTLPGHAGAVRAVAASPDGSTLASGGDDAAVCVWDVQTGSVRALLRGHEHPVRAVGFGPDGRSVVTAGDDPAAKVWDLSADPEGPAARNLGAAVAAVAVRPDGGGLVVAYADGSAAVSAGRGAAPRHIPRPGRPPFAAVGYPADGPPLAVELAGAVAAVWELGESPKVVHRADAGGSGSAVTAAVLAAGAGRLAVGDDRGRVAVWSLAEPKPLLLFDTERPGPVRHLDLSDDGGWVATQTDGHLVGVWHVGAGQRVYRAAGHGDGLWLLRFLPGEEGRVVTAGRGSSIKVWNTAGKEELALLGHVGRVTRLAASPDGRTLVSGGMAGEVKLWDLRTAQELVGLKRHAGPVTAAEFGAGGLLLVTGGSTPGGKGELAFWEAVKE